MPPLLLTRMLSSVADITQPGDECAVTAGQLRYAALRAHPKLVHDLTSRGPDEIDTLVNTLPLRRTSTRGRSWPLSTHDEVLLALLHRHRRVGGEALAQLFGISPSSVQAIIRHVSVAFKIHLPIEGPAPRYGRGCDVEALLTAFPPLAPLLASMTPPSPTQRCHARASNIRASALPVQTQDAALSDWEVSRQAYVTCEEEIATLQRRRIALRTRLMTDLYTAAGGGGIPAGDVASATNALVEAASARLFPDTRARTAVVLLLRQAWGLGMGEIATLLHVDVGALMGRFSMHMAELTPSDIAIVRADWIALLEKNSEMTGTATAIAYAETQRRAQLLLEEAAAHYKLPISEVTAQHTIETRHARVAASLLLRSLLYLSWERIATLLRGQTPKVLRSQASARRSEVPATDLTEIEWAWRTRVDGSGK